MSEPKLFKNENRLSQTMVSRGGMTVSEATAAAAQQIELVRDPTMAHIDAALSTIREMREVMQVGPDPDALREMYAAGNRVVATAGVFGLAELGQAAYCLCELVSRFQTGGKFNLKLIDVNVDGLRLLREPDNHSAEHRKAVLVGLTQMAASVA